MAPFLATSTPTVLQPEPLGIGRATDGAEHLIGHDVETLLGFDVKAVFGLGQFGHFIKTMDYDAPLLHFLMEGGTDIIIKAAQDFLAAIKDRDVRAEALEDAGELEGDVTCPDDDDALGLLFKMENLVGGDHQVLAGHIQFIGHTTRGDQDVVGRDGSILANKADRVRPDNFGPRLDDFDIVALEILDIEPVEPVDFGILARNQSVPVKAAIADSPAKTGGVFKVVREFGGIDP